MNTNEATSMAKLRMKINSHTDDPFSDGRNQRRVKSEQICVCHNICHTGLRECAFVSLGQRLHNVCDIRSLTVDTSTRRSQSSV